MMVKKFTQRTQRTLWLLLLALLFPALGQAQSAALSGTLQSATATTAVLDSATSVPNDQINGYFLLIVSGTGAPQMRVIDDWVSATDTATVATWTTTPDNTSDYEVYPFPVLQTIDSILTRLGTPAGASVSADIATRSTPSVKRATGFQWAIPSVTNAGVPVTTGTFTCTRSIDAPNAFAATTNSPSAISSDGFAELTISNADLNGTDYVILKCASSNTKTRTYYERFRLQAP